MAGIYSDVLLVDSHRNQLYDVSRSFIRDVLFVPVIFPYASLNNTEVRQIKGEDNKVITHLAAVSKESFPLYVASDKFVNKDDLLFWVVEDYSFSSNLEIEMESVLLLLKVKGLKAKFGSYGILYKTLDCTIENPSTLPQDVLDILIEAHEKRKGEFFASHNRVQQEP